VARNAPGSIARVQARGIHHLGVAVEDLDEAVTTYEQLFGASVEHRETVPEQGVEAASLKVGEGRVELLASLGEETPVGKFLTKRGPGMHHVAYEVDDVRAAIDELSAKGVELVDDQPRRGLFGLEVAFLHPDAVHGVLAELVTDA
jgi:methylmalonyl-CoA/ethylmalonyl-CoA epimerase